ncbi:MAG TPA: hypothetical protein VMR76_01960 [Candidatus Saccharimonadia bacterium]|nr:hypothetical protein [Candidatus Saccharimonadia bacterium]
MGYEAYALEYIDEAIMAAQNLAATKKMTDNIDFKLAEIDSDWPFEANYFDIAIDCFPTQMIP